MPIEFSREELELIRKHLTMRIEQGEVLARKTPSESEPIHKVIENLKDIVAKIDSYLIR